MRYQLILLICFLLSSLLSAQEKKVALVIGNSNYQNGAPLANPENDAEDIGEKLKSAGFEVSRYIDLSQTEMKKVIDEFGVSLDKADVGLFFYAGHGVQAKGKNYLIPIDAALKTENDVEYNCVDAGRILARMEDAGTSTNIVILDACRNNPFERSWSRNSNGNGLAYMDAPGGSLIAYSTAPGKTASDGYYRNSPFTSGLLEYMGTPNLNVEALFKLVRVNVMNNTNGQQVPWESTSLTGDFYFNMDQDKGQAKFADILPEYKEGLIEPPDYESQRQELAAGIRSVVILPFTNYTGDEDKEYLASGMHDALISELGQLGAVRVISKTSTLQYANFQSTIQEIAKDLNVDGVVETSLIGLGEDLRIQVKLYTAFPEEQMLWSEVFTSNMSDILHLYNQVTKNIADEIQISLTPEKESSLGESRKIDPDAYEAYLKGQFYWSKITPNDMVTALKYFELAKEKDTKFALAYAGICDYWIGAQQIGMASSFEVRPKAFEAAMKAFELDSTRAEVHYSMGLMYTWGEWDWKKGEASFKKAIEINPNHAEAHAYYSHLLIILGRFDEAMDQIERANELDPLSPLIKSLYGIVLKTVRRYDDAIKVFQEALHLNPTQGVAQSNIFGAMALAGREDEVIEVWLRAYKIPENLKAIERGYAEAGFAGANRRLAEVRAERSKIKDIHPLAIAQQFAIGGDIDNAMIWLEKTYEIHDPNLPYLKSPMYDKLREDSRFQDLCRRMNIPYK